MHVAGAMTTCVINIVVNDAKERPNLQAIFHLIPHISNHVIYSILITQSYKRP